MLELFLGLLVTAALSPVVRSFMVRHNVVDVPNHRSSHITPVPRGGGLACLGGMLVATAVAAFRGTTVPWAAVAIFVALSALGFADDRLSLPAVPRLATQLACGAVMGFSLGGWWGLPVGLAVTAIVVNAVNFMDGINAITSLTMAVWGVVALLSGRAQDLPQLWLPGALAAGAALGFLPWNAPTARLFLGDVGSYLFGGVAAAGVLAAWFHDAKLGLLVASPLTIYVVDVGWTLLRRARRRERLTEAHREHVYQRLLDLGLTHVAAASVAASFAVASAAATFWLPAVWALCVLAGLGGTYVCLPLVRRNDKDVRCA